MIRFWAFQILRSLLNLSVGLPVDHPLGLLSGGIGGGLEGHTHTPTDAYRGKRGTDAPFTVVDSAQQNMSFLVKTHKKAYVIKRRVIFCLFDANKWCAGNHRIPCATGDTSKF